MCQLPPGSDKGGWAGLLGSQGLRDSYGETVMSWRVCLYFPRITVYSGYY